MAADPERRRSSIFSKLSLFPRRSTTNSNVWEVRSEEDLGLDVSPVKNAKLPDGKRRVKTLERPSGSQSVKAASPLLPTADSDISLASRSHGSVASGTGGRNFGSMHSPSSDRPRPRTLDNAIPPISPLSPPSAPSVTSSDRSSSRRSSHIQLVPRSMLAQQSPAAPQSDELRRLERELLVIGAQERQARGLGGGGNADITAAGDRRRSDTSSSSSGKIRIQYVTRSSLTNKRKSTTTDSDAEVAECTLTPVLSFIEPAKGRINRSLTAVTEETRAHSGYQEEEDEDDDGEDKKRISESKDEV